MNLFQILLISIPVLVAAQSRTVGFDEALRMADSLHPDITTARSRIAELGYKRRQIAAGMFPQIDASASYTRLGQVPPGKKYLLGDSKNDMYTDLTARQALFDGGRYRYQKESLDRQVSSEEQKLELMRRTVRTAVSRAWLEAMRARYGVNIQRDLIARLGEQQAISELLYSSGKVSNLDILRIKTQILSARGQLRSLEAQLAAKHFGLAQAMGIADSVSVPEIADDFFASTPSFSAQCEVTAAVESSPEVSAALAAYEKSIVDKRVLQAEYLPTLWARGGFNLEDSDFLPQSQNLNWNAGVLLNVPIYRGGSIRAQVAAADERTVQASQAVESARAILTAKIRSALETVSEKQEKIAIAEQTWEAARETNDAAELRYSSGKLSAFELIDAQNVLARTRLDVINAYIDFRIALEEFSALCAPDNTGKGEN